MIALRFFACGSMEICIADFIGCCIATVSKYAKKVSEAIATLRPLFIRMPSTEEELRHASAAFYRIARFPRVIGAIDCTHIKIQSPGGTIAEPYRNRKGWFSFNVQTVAAANLKIINIAVRWPGSVHDQTIYNASSLLRRLQRGEFGNFIIVGDSGYANSRFLATPYLHYADHDEVF